MPLSLVLTTVSRRGAARLAKEAVEKRLAACGNISEVRSLYSWRGVLHDEAESLILFKTTKEKAPLLRAFLEKEHPYENPEIVELEAAGASVKYLSWVVESVAG